MNPAHQTKVKPYQQLIKHWRGEGLVIVPGVSKREMRDFESTHNVTLPIDFREYLSHVNGMAQVGGDDCDEKGFAFWPLRSIRSVLEEAARSKVEVPELESVDNYFAFADYLQWSWAYAICLAPAREGTILQFGTRSPRIVAGSFAEFVEAYIHDSEQLYLPRAG
jgi:hypothetical protein